MLHRIPTKSSTTSSIPQPTPQPAPRIVSQPSPSVTSNYVEKEQQTPQILSTVQSSQTPPSPITNFQPSVKEESPISHPENETISVDDRVQDMLKELSIQSSNVDEEVEINQAKLEGNSAPASPTPNVVVPKGDIQDLSALKSKHQDLNAKLQALRSRMETSNK